MKKEVLAVIISIFDSLGLVSVSIWQWNHPYKNFGRKVKIGMRSWVTHKCYIGKKLSRTEKLPTLNIPGFVGGGNSRLLRFSDASNKVYATWTYL